MAERAPEKKTCSDEQVKEFDKNRWVPNKVLAALNGCVLPARSTEETKPDGAKGAAELLKGSSKVPGLLDKAAGKK